MATGDKISAIQISTDSSSWYQRLRAIQKKTPTIAHGTTTIPQTADPIIISGSAASALSINDFINALNSLQSNVFLSYANWNSYKPAIINRGTLISSSDQQQKINNMLTSLENICANYQTYGQYNNICQTNTLDATNNNCNDLSNFNDDSNNPNCQTNGNYSQCGDNTNYGNKDVNSVDSYCGEYGNDGIHDVNTIDNRNDVWGADGKNGVCGDDGNYECDYDGNICTINLINENCVINSVCGEETNQGYNGVFDHDGVDGDNFINGVDGTEINNTDNNIDATNDDCFNYSNDNNDSINSNYSQDEIYSKCATNTVYSNYDDKVNNSKICSTYATYEVV